MRFIEKREEPSELADWKALANENWTPVWSDFRDPQKAATHRSLIEEQHHICCYCGRRIASSDSHIEHLQPRSDTGEDLKLSYANMLASCMRQQEKKVPLHCGAAKGDWFDKNMVHPLKRNCESRLRYTADGGVSAFNNDDEAASNTVDQLKLNIPKLQRERKAVIDVFLLPFLDGELTEEDVSRIIAVHQAPNKQNYLPAYGFAVAQVLSEFVSSD